MFSKSQKHILWFKEISKKDVPLVGGKNASLGEMFSKLSSKGISIPDGFVVSAFAYWYFLKKNKILPKLKDGKNVIICAHGNSIRALKKYLDNISDEDIINLEIPFGEVLISFPTQ